MLRLATLADRDAVYAIYMHPEVVPFLGYDPMPAEDFRPVFQELVDSGAFYILEREGEIAGFCRVTRQPGRASHIVYLGTLAVSPRWHGAGVARELMEKVTSMVEREGILRLELQLEADNQRAFAFYSKLGFKQEGRMRAAYKRSGDRHYVDEIFMARLLADLPVAERRVDRASMRINASRMHVYDAFVDPTALARWLPPKGSRGIIDTFEPRVGGEFRLTLVFDAAAGKTTDNTDQVSGRFVELIPGERIVWAIDFVSDNPAFAGTMTMTWSFADDAGGTRVDVTATDVPSGIRPEEHEAGMTSSLANLAEQVAS